MACQNDESKSSNQSGKVSAAFLEGNWVCKSFINRIKSYGSVSQSLKSKSAPRSWAFAFIPKHPDSVVCFSGENAWAVPVKYDGDTLELPLGADGKTVKMIYQTYPQKSLMMFDNSSGKVVQHYYTQGADKNSHALSVFFGMMNFETVGGTYQIEGSKEKVVFAPTGLLTGLPEYDYYQICVSKICQKAGEDLDCILLMNQKLKKEDWYGFALGEGNETVFIYNLEKNPAGSQPEFVFGKPKFVLKKLPAEKLPPPAQKPAGQSPAPQQPAGQPVLPQQPTKN